MSETEPTPVEESKSEESKPEEQKSSKVFIVIAVAFLSFLALDFIKDFVGQPLRQCSSYIAYVVLSLFSFPVDVNGTILKTPDLEFRVVPACSGSTTLQVLITLGIYWCWTHSRLTVERRILCSALTVPIAIIANGIRVAMLVGMSHSLGEAIEDGPLHSVIGLVGFALAMLALFLMTEWFATDKKSKGISKKALAIIMSLILFMIYMPFISSCVKTWKGNAYDPFDQFGFVFILAALVPLIMHWRSSPYNFKKEKLGLFIFIVSLVFILAGVLIDLKYLLGISIIISIFAFALAYKGGSFAISIIPLCVLIYIGFPKITVQINYVTSKLFGIPIWDNSLIVRLPLLVICYLLFFKLKKNSSEEMTEFQPRLLPVSLVVTAVLLSAQVFVYSSPSAEFKDTTLVLSYIQGDVESGWEGSDRPLSSDSIKYFGRKNIWYREYESNGKLVEVLINASGGNRHRNHPPEYCMTGDGWQIFSSEKLKKDIGPLKGVNLTKMRMKKEGLEKTFIYWFTDNEASFADYMNMMLEDTARRLTGQRTNWFLFRVITSEEDVDLDAFLSIMNFQIVDAVEEKKTQTK